MLSIKIHQSYRNVVALADADVIGKTFSEGKRQLDLRKNFYQEKTLTKEQAISILQQQADQDATFNIVGQKAIEAAQEAGIISGTPVTVQGIPFALKLA